MNIDSSQFFVLFRPKKKTTTQNKSRQINIHSRLSTETATKKILLYN